MISYGRQSLDQSDVDAVVKVLKGDWLTQGPAIERFENDLKQFFGAKHACAVSNGTAALHLTSLSLGWEPDNIIITSPITFLATVNCIVYSGSIPDFVDIDPQSYNIDPNIVEDKVKAYRSNGKQVKAIIGVDYAGHPCDWQALREIADKYNLQLVNDNCHALGASYCGDQQYAVKYADVVIQSYHAVKNITTGEGGSVLTNDTEIDEKIRRLRNHGMTKYSNQIGESFAPWYYEMHEIGYNYRITDIQSAMGSCQLKKLKRFILKRRKISKEYDKFLANVEYIKIPKAHSLVEHAYHLYPLQIEFKKLSLSKIVFFEKMKKMKFNLQVHYIPVYKQPFYQKNYSFNSADFPVSERFYANEVSLPIYPELSEDDQKKFIFTFERIING